jgi:hypothetical protein
VSHSPRARLNVLPARRLQTADGLPVHSWHSLIADLATLARNTVTTALAPENRFTLLTRPTPIQHKALQLLGVAL